MAPKNKGAERPREEKAAALIGLARRAGKVSDGGLSAENAVKQGKAFLIILAEDASGNTGKKFENMAAWHEVPIRRFLPARVDARSNVFCALRSPRSHT